MDYSSVFFIGDNPVNEEKPPARVCTRCNSDNTKFCYYNNYSVSQPRYFCNNCRRHWTHGGALRNIPIGGSSRKSKPTKVDQPFVSHVVSGETEQFNNHQPFLHVQETNDFARYSGGSSSSSVVVVENHFSSLAEIHGDIVTNVPLVGSFPPMEALDIFDYDVGSNDLIGNPLINQSIGGSAFVNSDYNNYLVNQEDPNMWNQSFNNTMNINHIASTSGSKGYIFRH